MGSTFVLPDPLFDTRLNCPNSRAPLASQIADADALNMAGAIYDKTLPPTCGASTVTE